MPFLRIVPIIAAAAVMSACAGASTAELSPASVLRNANLLPPPERQRITALELPQVQGRSALDALRQLRPEFLRGSIRRPSLSADQVPSVYQNERYAGGIEVLALIPLAAIAEIRHVQPVEARARLGNSCECDAGVILVRTR